MIIKGVNDGHHEFCSKTSPKSNQQLFGRCEKCSVALREVSRIRDCGARESPPSVLLHDDGGEVDRQRVLQHLEPELPSRLLCVARVRLCLARVLRAPDRAALKCQRALPLPERGSPPRCLRLARVHLVRARFRLRCASGASWPVRSRPRACPSIDRARR